METSVWAIDTHYNIVLLRYIKPKTKSQPQLFCQHQQIALPCSLLSVRTSSPLSCSLLMYRLSVQRRKACLLRWRVSKKGRQPVRCPSLPLLQFSRQNNRSLSPCRVCSPSRRGTSHASVVQSADYWF